jgi:hypothetical protein
VGLGHGGEVVAVFLQAAERLGDVRDDGLVQGGSASVSAADSAFSLGRLDSCGCRSCTSRSTNAP